MNTFRLKSVLLSSLLFFSVFGMRAWAQQTVRHACAADEHLELFLKKNPNLHSKIDGDNIYNEKFAEKYRYSAAKTSEETYGLPTLYVIPCVVHVVFDNDPRTPDSISVDQIRSQFKALFECYRKVPGTMGWGSGADIQVEFSLATRDPQGRATNGVVYHRNPELADVDRSNEDDDLKRLGTWDRTKYLNIWLVNNISSIAVDQGVLGYAQFPTMPESTDGIVVRSYIFGTIGTAGLVPGLEDYKFGRTMVHEAGHWLNMYHTFQGGCGETRCNRQGDFICDTPPVQEHTFGFGEERKNTCTADVPDRPDNLRNYMDYLTDAGLNFFTQGQKVRAFACLENSGFQQRNLLWQDANLRATGTGPYKKPVANFWAENTITCSEGSVRFYNYSEGQPDEFQWEFEGGNPATSTERSPVVKYNLSGRYKVKLTVKNKSGQEDVIEKTNYIEVGSFSVIDYPFTENFTRSNFPPPNWTIRNPDAANTRISKTWTTSRGYALIRGFEYSDYGQYDDLITPPLDFFELKKPTLTYRWAYAPYRNRTLRNYIFGDTFEILASRNCGLTFEPVFRKSVTRLSSTGGTLDDRMSQPFDEQWANETICLDELAGTPSIQLAFRFTSGFGNNFFLDDIKIENNENDTRSCAVNRANINEAFSEWKLVPNPVSVDGKVAIQLNLKEIQDIEVSITNTLGKTVFHKSIGRLNPGKHELKLNLPTASGIYLIQLQTNGFVSTQKLVIQE